MTWKSKINTSIMFLGFFERVHTLRFSGVALEDEGKRICDRLSRFKEKQIVEVEAETGSYELFERICEIDEITIPLPEVDKAPAIYRFYGYLKRVE